MRTLSYEILRRASIVAFGAVALAGAAGCPIHIGGGDGVCEYNGATYQVGESFPSEDGCNTCSCVEDGSVACTEMACVDGCEWEGQFYLEGESFPAGDGCNTCSCMPDGQVGCTLMACPVCEYNGQGHQPGDEFPAGDGCNTCTCLDDGQVACTEMACPIEACSHEGYFHAPGESWMSHDQCQSCTCESGGQVICSDNDNCTTCYYTGTLYQSGDTFPSIDGCNTCTCDAGGVACTQIACACDPAAEWWRDYVGDPETCQLIDYVCSDGTTSFFNDCGCGCEQPAWCPQSFDCMPPASCDLAVIAQLCPFSGIAL